MSLSSAMEIGKTGLNIYRVAIEVTSQNIANVNTDGYSRQRVLLQTSPETTANGFPMGTGVQIASIERYYDSLLQKQLVNAETTQGYDTATSNVLLQIEPAFNEVSNDGLGTAITDLFSAFQDLSLNPTGTTERQVVLTRAQLLVDNFNSVSTSLTDAIATQNDALPSLTTDINTTLQSIAKLNSQIKITEQVSGNANEMRDQRDLLIRNLSSQIGITFTENTDGTTDVTYADSGDALVTGGDYGSFSLTTNATTGNYDVNLTPVGGTASVVAPTSGELGATITLRDTTIPGYLTQLNSLATTIATTVNTQHQAGYDLNGTGGLALFTYTATTSAATIAVNTAITSTDQIAASGSATLAGDNSNALSLAQLETDLTMSGNSTTFSSFFNTMVSKIGLDVQSSENTVSQDAAFLKQLTALRESNSGVSLDEELTNLVKYQRSYQASAKVISTASDMMDVVINMIR